MNNKEKIAFVFEKMMNNNTISNISVVKIMDECKLPRTEFYRHFKDKYDVMTYVYSSAIEERLRKENNKDWRNMTRFCYQYMYEKKDFFTNIVRYKNQNNFLEFLYEYSYITTLRAIKTASGRDSIDYELDVSLKMYCSSCAFLVGEWLKEGLKKKPEYMCDIVFDNIPKYLEVYMKNLELVPE